MARVPVPQKMRNVLLRKNAGACCVCKARNVGVNFHHIDGDPSNTVEENIAVLCVRDHDAHHRPEDYHPHAAVNHLELSRETIASKKTEWEAFVVEARRPKPAILATLTGYGTMESIHSAKLAFQWADGRVVFERAYHLFDGPLPRWVDWILAELAWVGNGITLVLVSEPVPVEHCPSCAIGMTRTIPAGWARRLTSPTWSSSSACSIYINPDHARLVVRIEDDHGEAFVARLHRCGAYLDLATNTYQERLPITQPPSVRAQAARIVRKLLRDWQPAHTFIGTGPSADPVLIDRLKLPVCWEARAR